MALATTSAVWRSTGGDSTRTAYAGSMKMAAQFYASCASNPGTKATKNDVMRFQTSVLVSI